ncbi:VOC family protein [Cryobacterium sp.]|jgi:catechol 2,3-dioxygenase-like lactoylglutathione lyase family enzyme|uniref:bleomycin resistance protein n=1 Tax=Cryobacterium sp. TaxID=1926290 RepID=UPI0026055F6F|nr:VOC family protein [Cryobacterium sp.]MCU1445066.1 bleomycin resistance family protein [Cryobacterium sp.]
MTDPGVDASSTPEPRFFPDLVPELLVDDVAASLTFWVGLCGFEVLYDRPNEGFAYLHSGTAHLMLEQVGAGRNWIPGALDRPLGRGVNFPVMLPAIAPLLARLAGADWPLFMPAETKWYDTGATQAGVAQFLVQDPDGYLVRFSSRLVAPNDPPR